MKSLADCRRCAPGDATQGSWTSTGRRPFRNGPFLGGPARGTWSHQGHSCTSPVRLARGKPSGTAPNASDTQIRSITRLEGRELTATSTTPRHQSCSPSDRQFARSTRGLLGGPEEDTRCSRATEKTARPTGEQATSPHPLRKERRSTTRAPASSASGSPRPRRWARRVGGCIVCLPVIHFRRAAVEGRSARDWLGRRGFEAMSRRSGG